MQLSSFNEATILYKKRKNPSATQLTSLKTAGTAIMLCGHNLYSAPFLYFQYIP